MVIRRKGGLTIAGWGHPAYNLRSEPKVTVTRALESGGMVRQKSVLPEQAPH